MTQFFLIYMIIQKGMHISFYAWYEMKVLILAAGKGKRLGSELTQIPKVLRKACGRPLLAYVLDTVSFAEAKDITIIVGYQKEKVMEAFQGYDFAFQEEQKGTGHAVMCAEKNLEGYDGDVLVVCGDMPLIQKSSVERLIKRHKKDGNACTLLTFTAKGEVPPFGRIIRDKDGRFLGIVEHKDATEEQRKIRELNVGIYVFNCKELFKALKKITASKETNELYLTDVPMIMFGEGLKIDGFTDGDEDDFKGVNTEDDLRIVEEIINKQKNK